MENNNPASGFNFLSEPQVQKYFAELNIELLRGRHIMASSSPLFSLLDNFENEFTMFYESLYGLILERRSHDNVTYFYLNFPLGGKGKLANPSFYVEMDGRTTIVACILANFYFTNYFSYDKKFQWDDIRYEIEHGEHRDAYQQLFFTELRSDYTDKEWDDVKKLFSKAINFFGRVGLVEKEEAEDEMQFTILPPIHHFMEMYQNEIGDIDNFLQSLKPQLLP